MSEQTRLEEYRQGRLMPVAEAGEMYSPPYGRHALVSVLPQF